MMRRLYSLLLVLLVPVAFGILLLRGLKERAYWAHLRERFGWGPATDTPGIWLHAVSVGEVSAAAALIRALRVRFPEVPIALSTATPTGRDQAAKLLKPDIDVRYLPYDTPGSVRRFLARIRPRVAIIMETELWPNLLHQCRLRGVPVVIASARLSLKSVSRYRRFGALFSDAFAAPGNLVAAQTEEDARRFIAIGADRDRTHVIGNVKFDMQPDDSLKGRGRALRAGYLGARPVWIAGSTHGGEEEMLVCAHGALRAEFADALLVLVPRHPQRFESVASMLARQEVEFDRRSSGNAVRAGAAVLLVDTMGELATMYAAADVAFVGGSLVPVGGHNLLEPAALGVPVITGPYTENSKEIARQLVQRGGAVEVADAEALAGVLREWFADPVARQRVGACAREFVEAHRGSSARLLDLIDPLLA
jgi:3-deoxy-D-manno-octulosonic-acid transferase